MLYRWNNKINRRMGKRLTAEKYFVKDSYDYA